VEEEHVPDIGNQYFGAASRTSGHLLDEHDTVTLRYSGEKADEHSKCHEGVERR
jgi:hypothetical protein